MRASRHGHRSPRRLTTTLALLALALAGCGKGQSAQTTITVKTTAPSTAPGKTPSTPGASTKKPSQPGLDGLSGAKIEALAAAINLRPSDLPAFTTSAKRKQTETAREKELSGQFRRCLGEPGSGSGERESGELSSPSFERSASLAKISAHSEVTFASSPQAADAQLALIRSAKARSCFQAYVQALFTGGEFKNAKASKLQIQSATPPTPGMTGGFALRMTTSFSIHGLRLPIYLDLLGFVKEDAEVTLFTSGLLATFPAREEERLFTLLLERARARHL